MDQFSSEDTMPLAWVQACSRAASGTCPVGERRPALDNAARRRACLAASFTRDGFRSPGRAAAPWLLPSLEGKPNLRRSRRHRGRSAARRIRQGRLRATPRVHRGSARGCAATIPRCETLPAARSTRRSESLQIRHWPRKPRRNWSLTSSRRRRERRVIHCSAHTAS